jgi:hypothetical protein
MLRAALPAGLRMGHPTSAIRVADGRLCNATDSLVHYPRVYSVPEARRQDAEMQVLFFLSDSVRGRAGKL